MNANLSDLPFLPECDAFIEVEGDLDEYVESRRTVVVGAAKQVAGISRRLNAGLVSFLSRGFSPAETTEFEPRPRRDDRAVWTVATSTGGLWSQRAWIIAYCANEWVVAVSTRNRERGDEAEYTVWAGKTTLPKRYRERFAWRKAVDVVRWWSLCEHEVYPPRCPDCRGPYHRDEYVVRPHQGWSTSKWMGDPEDLWWHRPEGAVVAHLVTPYGEVVLWDDEYGSAFLGVSIEGRDRFASLWPYIPYLK